ncbi:nucleotidyltransferase [Alkalibacillus sp. S2W]|uniref:nucleotidyltransferase n=1 Tax=Alkalibacillus TaxID=331654 RepID=UPI0014228380|nr:nucleotidyltransferase [Alkalibacillus almallahensis]NIK10682.1 putative nucleotidyltransferase [Alkalibacillus almallahensis]
MKACGLIVEYNPFHNGHLYHQEASRTKTNAEITVAVMSSSFLQRGEPGIIDKFSRTQAALKHGVDVVVELPFIYAVQYADLFAHGAVSILNALGVDYLCFGSESGDITEFTENYDYFNEHEDLFNEIRQNHLNEGQSFPQASTKAYEAIGLRDGKLDLGQPNNILGFSYVKAIRHLNSYIQPETITRTKSHYHDETIDYSIASATSIRKDLFNEGELSDLSKKALPDETINQLITYQQTSGLWHEWELYFPHLQLLVQTHSHEQLRHIHGMIEGLEYRLKQTVNQANNFQDWMERLKTKRYTWTRLQRMFVHLLTNTTKTEVDQYKERKEPPYIRLLGMSSMGREWINLRKKSLDVPLISNLQQLNDPLLNIEERATDAYYSPIPPHKRYSLKRQEIKGPIIT